MRRKKHLNERIEKVRDVLIEMQCRGEDVFAPLHEDKFFNSQRVFGNNNPLYIEIGCGKGGFAIKAAKLIKDINFIAIEKNPNVLVTGAEALMKDNLPNLKFCIGEAENLTHLFKENSAERIYLNFSCPYFKKSYFKNRLTYSRFLKVYRQILVPDGEVHMKTDNQNLFEFSLEQFSQNQFHLKNISLNLHQSGFKDNIMTEYEEKFVAEGLPIYRLEAVNKKI